MKKFFWLPTMAVAAVLMLNSCELFCEQYAELFCETECPEEITSILVYLEPFTITGTRATGGAQTKSVTNDNGSQSINTSDKVLLVMQSEDGGVILSTATASSSGNPVVFTVDEGLPGVQNGAIALMVGVSETSGSTNCVENRFQTIDFDIIAEKLTDERSRIKDPDLNDNSPAILKVGVVDGPTQSVSLENMGAVVGFSYSSNTPATLKRINVTTNIPVFGDIYLTLADLVKGKTIPHYSGDVGNSHTVDFGEGALLGSEASNFKIPIPVTDGTVQVAVSMDVILDGSSDTKTFIIPELFEVGRSTMRILPSENISDLPCFINLNTWNEATKKYNYASSYQIPVGQESYCFVATVKGNDEGTISPVSVAVISQQAATGLDGTTGNVVENVRLSGGQVTFEAGSPGEAVIGAYDASGNLLASWIIYCGPRPSTN